MHPCVPARSRFSAERVNDPGLIRSFHRLRGLMRSLDRFAAVDACEHGHGSGRQAQRVGVPVTPGVQRQFFRALRH